VIREDQNHTHALRVADTIIFFWSKNCGKMGMRERSCHGKMEFTLFFIVGPFFVLHWCAKMKTQIGESRKKKLGKMSTIEKVRGK
jgi:hypothetical protein